MTSSELQPLVEPRGPYPRPREFRLRCRDFIYRRLPGVPGGEDLLIALEEAYSNILEHSQESAGGRLAMEAGLAGSRFIFRFQDEGSQGHRLRFHQDQDPENSRVLLKRVASDKGGMGLLLIRKVMDMISYDVSPGGTNTLHLEKYIRERERMAGELIVETRMEGPFALAVLRGYINMDTIDFFDARLKEFSRRENPRGYLFDVTELEYVSSAGVTLFVDLYDELELKGGRVALVGLNPGVRRVFDLLGFLTFFGEASTREEALAWLAR